MQNGRRLRRLGRYGYNFAGDVARGFADDVADKNVTFALAKIRCTCLVQLFRCIKPIRG